jgi:transposase
LSNELDVVTEVRESAEQWLHEEAASRCTIVKLLAAAPGIGMTRAAQIVAIVVSPTRLPDAAAVLELLRPGHRDALFERLGSRSQRNVGAPLIQFSSMGHVGGFTR